MKVTNRVLQTLCRDVNAGVLKPSPVGIRVDQRDRYYVALLYRRPVAGVHQKVLTPEGLDAREAFEFVNGFVAGVAALMAAGEVPCGY